MPDIFTFLDANGIAYEKHEHPAVFTCEESEALEQKIPGESTKNLFLKDDKKKRFFLVVVGHEKSVNLKALGILLGVKGLSFVGPELLKEYLGVEPGSVTMLGLINDTDHHVEVIFDQRVWDAESINCHPLVNTVSLVISHAGVETFLKAVNQDVRVLDLPVRL